MTFSIIQVNATIGNIQGNSARICEYIKSCDSDILVFPEMVLQGYLPYDFFSYTQYRQLTQALQAIMASLKDQQIAILGVALPFPSTFASEKIYKETISHSSDVIYNQTLYNCAVVLSNKGIVHIQVKHILPYYDVFFENRFFLPASTITSSPTFRAGDRLMDELPHEYQSSTTSKEDTAGILIVQDIDSSSGIFTYHDNCKIGILICEDIWYVSHNYTPITALRDAHPTIVVCLSASPFEHHKLSQRLEVSAHAVRTIGAPLLFTNLVGGNDEVVFDGRSFIMDADTRIHRMLAHCKEDMGTITLAHQDDTSNYTFSSYVGAQENDTAHDSTQNTSSTIQYPCTTNDITHSIADVLPVLSLGLVDYLEKTQMAQSVHVGLSGGIDSAVTAAVAVHALGATKVTGILLPSAFTSQESIDDALALAENLGISTLTLSIESLVATGLGELEEVFALHPARHTLTEENIQARMRGVLLMAYSNRASSMLLTTGNKSEIAVGYCTLYGDMCGSLNLIGDLYKTEVYQLAHYLNRNQSIIPQSIIDKEPTAELRENQKDSDSLPPYNLLDVILHKYIEEKATQDMLIAQNIADEHTIRHVWSLYVRSEYKRYQAPPIIKVSSNAFGRGRLVPLASNFVQ